MWAVDHRHMLNPTDPFAGFDGLLVNSIISASSQRIKIAGKP